MQFWPNHQDRNVLAFAWSHCQILGTAGTCGAIDSITKLELIDDSYDLLNPLAFFLCLLWICI